ncbi:MAG: response regulator, partial [candidate division Zixibacteria bacterium]|nr:response regulator [candidate division Zixibacteria bacterium]
ILETGIVETTFRRAAQEITRVLGSLGHGGGSCFLVEEGERHRYVVGEFSGGDGHDAQTLDTIAAAASRSLGEIAQSDSTAQESRFVDLSDCATDEIQAAVAVDVTPDVEHRCALVIWTQGPTGFTENDLELLTVLAVTARNVLTYAVNMERISKSKRTLEKSSSRMADAEAFAALTDMTTGIAHDFNNVMGGIVGRVQLMKMKVDEGPMAAGLNQVESLAMEGAETVRRIQEFTRRTRNKKLSPMDLADVLETCLGDRPSTWRERAQATGVDVVCAERPETAVVDGDSDDLTTLMDKLIENAVEHSPSGGTVEVALVQKRSQWVLTVTDRGDGVPDEVRKKVFYPFFTTKTSRGAGLGLAIAHGIVVGHGGRIELDDCDPAGTVVRVSLRSSGGVIDESDITNRDGVSDRLRILVVDDDEQIRDILGDMLTIDGHSSTTCADGYEALEAIDEQPYDLVITDLGMPGMSGLDLAAVVHEKYPELPIAMITGWGTQLDEEDASLKGIKIVLPKPFHLKDVKSLVRDLAVR